MIHAVDVLFVILTVIGSLIDHLFAKNITSLSLSLNLLLAFQVFHLQHRETAMVLLVCDRSRVLQHPLCGCGALSPAQVAK